MIFNFIVRHLHFLARIPLTAHFFDGALLTWTALFHHERLRAIEAIQKQALTLRDVRLCSHRYGGIGFEQNGCEFAHLHGNGLFDVELTRNVAAELIAHKRALPHHVLGPSRWISFWVDSLANVPDAFSLLQLACEMKKADQTAGLLEIPT
jgi:hypothetical protein